VTETHGKVTVTLVTADRHCRECDAARRMLGTLVERSDGRVDLRELRRSDPEAAPYGIILTPLVAVDGINISMGRRPPLGRIEGFLKERGRL
jgi:hypothetical protein